MDIIIKHYFQSLAYAITGHKSQGTTISSKVIMGIKKTFALGLTYVMLSRVTNRMFLKIIGNFTPNNFIHYTFENDYLTTISCKHPNSISIHVFSNL